MLCYLSRGLVFCLLVLGARAAEPLAEFRCEERLGRTWREMPLTYPVAFGPGQVREDGVRLLASDGQPVPCQFTRVERHPDGSVKSARLVFRAALAPHGAFAFRLEPGTPPVATAEVAVVRGPEGLTLDSGPFAIRLPPEGETTFPQPRPFPQADTADSVPGPLQGFRLHGGEWVGGSRFAVAMSAEAPAFLGWSCAISEQGPLFTEAVVQYRLEDERTYRFTVRLAPGDTAAWIDERYDLKWVGETPNWQALSPRDPVVVFALSAGQRPGGWRPDHLFWERQPYGSGVQPGKTPVEATLAKHPGFDFTKTAFGTHELPYDATRAGTVVGIEPWSVFGNYVFYVGLVRADQVGEAAPPFVGLMPVHAGNWRGDGPYTHKWLTTTPDGEVAWRLPLAAQIHPNRSVHTGEYDPDLPYTFGQRQWVLFGGPLRSLDELHDFRRYEGYVNLDDYKEWILEWPVDPHVTYPRLLFDAADMVRARAVLAAGETVFPSGAATMREWLSVDDDPQKAAALYARFSGDRGYWSSALGQINADLDYWFPLWRQGHATSGWVCEMEDLLSSHHLSDEQRQTLRMQLAAMASLAAEPDYGPRGGMAHLGNPNMAIIRFMPLLYTAALIPDHPQADTWLDTMSRFFEYKLFSNTAPGGGWSELFTYYDASAPTLIHAAHMLDRLGRLRPEARRLTLELAAQPLFFQAPLDPRLGRRTVPNWGHEGHGDNFGHWLPASRLAAKEDPELAAALLWGWAQSGYPLGGHDNGFSRRCLVHLLGTAPPVTPSADWLRSHWTPGLGAALRAHPGDPDETFLAYRQGYLISHCDDNQGDFVLSGKGAPLVDMSLAAYPLHQHPPFIELNATFGWYSTPRLAPQDVASDMGQGSNNRNLIGAWNASSDIHVHAFGPSVDYLHGHADYPPHRWSRQILFLKGATGKSPNYFVFRDSFDLLPGHADAAFKPYWWNIRTVGPSAQVRAVRGGLDYTSPYGPRLLVRFPALKRVKVETRDATRIYNQSTNTLAVSAVGPIAVGRDTVAVLYPAAADERAPRITTVGDGALRIETAEGTDWVFVDRKLLRVVRGEVAFSGVAGAVRVRADTVHLVVAEGPAEVRYRGVTLVSDLPTTRIIPRADADTVQRIVVATPDSDIRFTPPSGDAVETAPGVTRISLANGYALAFNAETPLDYAQDGVWFRGRRGGIVVDEAAGTVRLVVIDGEGVGTATAAVWNGVGPYDLTFRRDGISGHHAGAGRSINVTLPHGVDRYATVVVDGIPGLPGSSLTTDPASAGRGGIDPAPARRPVLVLPLLEGEHTIEVRNLEQPPVFRNWQAW